MDLRLACWIIHFWRWTSIKEFIRIHYQIITLILLQVLFFFPVGKNGISLTLLTSVLSLWQQLDLEITYQKQRIKMQRYNIRDYVSTKQSNWRIGHKTLTRFCSHLLMNYECKCLHIDDFCQDKHMLVQHYSYL